MQRVPYEIITYNVWAVRNVLLGGGIAYAIEKDKLWHLPIVCLFPSPYAGYQLYKNREDVLRVLRNVPKN